MGFQEQYQELNDQQRLAVDTIDGPMLVIAGPGTGKTQLLSMRVANIMKLTDTAPVNILCLTFTDNAARNMRERLETIIGQAAYHVSIHTFHSFGVDIINQYPDYFTSRQLIQQIDELGSYELLHDIFENLTHSNPLSATVGDEYAFLQDTLAVISWLKQNAVRPDELHALLSTNHKFIKMLNPLVSKTFVSSPSAKFIKAYQSLQRSMAAQTTTKTYFGFADYGNEAARELADAISSIDSRSRYAPKITEWRNKWCHKTADGKHVFKDGGRNYRKMQAVANVYQSLLEAMSRLGLYDFDDMIMETVHTLENNQELKANLQERFQYILVDEFQDTNKAQLRILAALGDNPLFENRPNIMAVGDDDQAIYAFQGAEVSNMAIFAKQYAQPTLIGLTDNYRSSANILQASQAIAEQIDNRLTDFSTVTKQLTSRQAYPKNNIEHIVLPSELAQYSWLAEHIAEQIGSGVAEEQIAVLAPRHRYLERLMPYLAKQGLPIAYERRENILDAPIIVQLVTMAKLIVAIAENQHSDINALLAEVLSYEFWNISNKELVQLSVRCFTSHTNWLPAVIKHKNPQLAAVAHWFIDLARHSTTEPLEYVLDNLLGVTDRGQDSEIDVISSPAKPSSFISPMRKFYFSTEGLQHDADSYLVLLGQLSTLRQRLRAWKPTTTLYTADLVQFVDLHRQAHLKIIDTNPHTQSTKAIQVMTAYKAKGLEFEYVYVINAQDEVWGATARHRSSRIKLPENLPIQPLGDNDNDKLRLLFVALTRAKHHLTITSYTHDLENRLSPGLSFIGGNKPAAIALIPSLTPKLQNKPATARAAEILATDWSYRFRQIIADKQTLFEPILADYKLSVTHLNNFTDLANAGPDYFFIHNLLRFPEALTPAAAYGDAIHRSLHWLHTEIRQKGKPPAIKPLQAYFEDMLSRKHLRTTDFKRLNQRGRQALALYYDKRVVSWQVDDLVERGFNNEGVVINNARLSGKIDKMHFIKTGQVEVIDFKTGKPATSWQGKDEIEKIKLYKYRQQLLFYKLLVEHSASFDKKVSVNQGSLEFIEQNENGVLVDNLQLDFKAVEVTRLRRLIGKVWQCIIELRMPDVSKYPKTLKGIQTFEDDLLTDKT